jgi:hypothetical protein
MTGWDIEAWQLSILVTTAIVLVEAAVNALLRHRLSIAVHRRFRTAALGALVVLTVTVFVAALGPSLADELSSVAAAVAAVVALWLTYRSYQSSRDPALPATNPPASATPTALAEPSAPAAAPAVPAASPALPPASPAAEPTAAAPRPRRPWLGRKTER